MLLYVKVFKCYYTLKCSLRLFKNARVIVEGLEDGLLSGFEAGTERRGRNRGRPIAIRNESVRTDGLLRPIHHFLGLGGYSGLGDRGRHPHHLLRSHFLQVRRPRGQVFRFRFRNTVKIGLCTNVDFGPKMEKNRSLQQEINYY